MAECCNREEQNNLSEDASDDICSLFNMFPQGFLSGESLKSVAISQKITDIEDIFEPLDLTDEERELQKIAISEKNRNRFSKKNVEEYVATLLSDKAGISASELPAETKRDIIRIIFISLYGHSAKCGYVVIPKDEVVSSQGFKFRNFEIKRRVK